MLQTQSTPSPWRLKPRGVHGIFQVMERRVPTSQAAYPEPLDAIVLAGTDDNPRRMIQGQNKAFLEIAGKSLVLHVVEALLESPSVGEIFVVGPIDRLHNVLNERYATNGRFNRFAGEELKPGQPRTLFGGIGATF